MEVLKTMTATIITPSFFRSSEFANISGVRHLFLTKNLPNSSHVYLRADFEVRNIKGNQKEVTSRNRQIAIENSDFPIARLSILNETHTSRAVVAHDLPDRPPEIEADAQVTNRRGLALGILSADCVPVLLADGKNRVIGAAHAGWKGAFNGVLQNTVSKMNNLGAVTSEVKAVIGPCIHQNNYEVGPEFFKNFINQSQENKNFFRASSKPEHFLFDLPGYVTSILKEIGITTVLNIDKNSFVDSENLFSYRRSKAKNTMLIGNNLSVVMLE